MLTNLLFAIAYGVMSVAYLAAAFHREPKEKGPARTGPLFASWSFLNAPDDRQGPNSGLVDISHRRRSPA